AMSRASTRKRDQLDLFVARPAFVREAAVAPGVESTVTLESTTSSATVAIEPIAPERKPDARLDAAPPLPDAAARSRIEEDLDTNLLVEAGAGAGKTRAMVGRMVALIRAGRAHIAQIAAVTFTRKAAAELRERFQTELEKELLVARTDDDTAIATRMDAALRDIDRAFVGTIHSFCARLLRERPLDAGIDPGFRELMAGEEQRLRREYWSKHVERLAAEGDDSLGDLSRVGLRPAQLFTLFETLTDYADVSFPSEPVPRPDPSPARRELEALMEEAEPLMPVEEPEAGWDELQTAIRSLRFYRRLGWEDDVRFLDALASAFSSPNRITIVRWDEEAKVAAKALSNRFNDFASEDGVGGRTLSQWYAHRYPVALSFAGRAATEYAEERRRAGMLSFQDLLMLTAELLRSRPAAREELSERYRFVLVDEFQDTDPVQAEVLFLLAAEAAADWHGAVPRPGALFVVGDPKQSIYRFRRADITLYSQVKERFRSFGAVLELTANFRSRPPIERFVNETFRRHFPKEPTAQQAAFAPMRVVWPDAEPQGVFFYSLTRKAKRDLDVDLAAQDADRVASWIAARVRAGDRSAGDFMVLTRRKKHL
ncbi:MAG: UvrD-helicase domain-containing protein, partial [Longimicrobiales bacterium]